MLGHWEHYEHDADVGVRGLGATKAEAFEQAALALTAAVADLGSVRPIERVQVNCEAPDDEGLLAEWLNALLAEMAARRMLFSRFHVEVQESRLTAQAWGEALDPSRHRPAAAAKAATAATARVARHADGWLAQTVIDL